MKEIILKDENTFHKNVLEDYNNLRKTARRMEFQIKIDHSTIIRRLAQIRKVRKMDKWTFHELNDIQKFR